MTIPFEYRDRRIWVRSGAQNRQFWVLLDTGSDGTAIDAALAQGLGLKKKRTRNGSTVAGDMRIPQVGPLELTLGDRPIEIPELSAVPLEQQLPDLGMILGFDVLRSIPLTINYAARRIRLDRLPEGERFDFVPSEDIRPTTTLEAFGSEFQAMLDTGSSQGVSLPYAVVLAKAPSLLGDAAQREVLGDELQSRSLRLERVQLGSVELEDVEGEAVSAKGGSFADQEAQWANIGNKVLDHFRLGIDGKRRQGVLRLED